ncbi:MAG: hypothetical protein KC478_06805 [Bacteriovoracaceae bacterium]|nr:hypothetical protein [Bacteriovoracaceae bacterium]
MNQVVVLPVFIALCFALMMFFFKKHRFAHHIGLLGLGAILAASVWLLYGSYDEGILVAQLGGWRPPYGISFQADVFSSLINVFIAILAICAYVFSMDEIKSYRAHAGYYSAMFTLYAGANGVLFAGDIFNMYVWIEVLVVSSFLLLSMGQDKKQITGALPYVLLNFLGSMFILSTIALLYGLTGALNIAQISIELASVPDVATATFAAMFIVGIGIKSAIFPLFFWLPESYHRPPAAVSAFFAGVVTKVGVCALFKLFGLVFFREMPYFKDILVWIGILTMVTGVLGAVALYDIRRLLSYHIISQIGYMIFGLALFGVKGLSAAIFFIIHNIIAKSNLFFIGAELKRLGGSYNLQKTRALYRAYPFMSILFFISAYSLAGIPPLSGFWGKLGLAQAGIEEGEYFGVAVCFGVGLLTTYSMTKVWILGFWECSDKTCHLTQKYHLKRNVPIFILSAISLYLGLFPTLVLDLSTLAAEQLLSPELYIQKILGGAQ